jgi:hypothetical protein
MPHLLACPTSSVLFTIATFRNIVWHDGFRGLYRGLGATILGYLPTWAIYFAVYDGIKTHFGEAPLGLDTPVAKSERLYPAPSAKGYQPIVREHPWSLHILSAMIAGATSTICTNPLWVIKTRFMVRVFSSSLISRRLHHGGQTQSRSETKIPPHIRRCHHNLSQRRHSRILSRTFTQLIRHHSRRRAVPTLRKAQDRRSCVASFTPHVLRKYNKNSHRKSQP